MNRYTLKFYKDDMGSFTQPGCRNMEDALWHVNDARSHDGLRPLDSLHCGSFKFNKEESTPGEVITVIMSLKTSLK